MPVASSTIYCAERRRRTQVVVMSDHTPRSELLEILINNSVQRGRFELSSGATSDLYVDAKRTTSDPRAALLVGAIGWDLLRQNAESRGINVDSIGGLTMGADWMALSIAIAAQLHDPRNTIKAFSVRKSAKKHGLHKRIEGNFDPSHHVVVVDDVITTGGSTLQAIDVIEQLGGHIAFVLVLVDREEGGRQAIQDRGYQVVPIFTRADVSRIDVERSANLAPA